MKQLRVFVLLIFSSLITINAQEKQLTLEDVILRSYSSFSPSNLEQLSWIPNSNLYSYVDYSTGSALLVQGNASSGKKNEIVSLDWLNHEIKKFNEDSLKRFPRYNWTGESTFSFWIKNTLYEYDLGKSTISPANAVKNEAENMTVAENNKYAAFTIDNNLYVALEPGKVKQITFDESKDIVNGQSVHRNEFGINGGIFWSPNSKYIAFYRMDESDVTNYPLVDIDPTPAELNNIKYPMAGQTSHYVTLGIYDINTEKTVWLKSGEPKDQYLTCVTWDPNEKNIYIAHLNRDQNHLQLKKYDINTGDMVKILFEEKNEKYVEPENPLYFLPSEKNKFVWFSERDGWDHLYLYDTEGKLIKQLTKGDWVVTSFDGFDTEGKYIFFTATKESPIERQYYKVNIQYGDITKLTEDEGIHNVSANFNHTYFTDNFSSIDVPREIRILTDKGVSIGLIHKSDNPLKDYKTGSIRLFKIKDNDNIDLYCRMYLPPDLDTAKKYPVIVYVYGGPHAQLVLNSWQRTSWFDYMSQQGYIIFTLDNRGSANRGLAFEQATFRRLGTFEIQDQLEGVDYLKSLIYVDPNRIGVFGWSYGGFMATSLMLRTNGTYKVGVGGGAVIDWKYYEVMYTERYMDTPQTNPDGYEEASLLNYVDKLKGKLLLVHGTSDPVVVWQNTLAFAKKAANLNVPLDYFPYVGHQHGVVGRDALHLYNKITDYFKTNL